MLDVGILRENPELVKESQRRRDPSGERGLVDLVDVALEKDKAWRQARTDLDRGNQESNRLSKEVGRLKKAGEDTTEAQKAAKEQEAKVRELERRHEEAEREAGKSLAKIGNLVHDDVPVSADEADNEVVRRHGQGRPQKGLYNHVDLVRMLGMVELEKGAEVAGSRGYFLRGYGTLLNHALISYAMAFLARRGFEPHQTPYFLTHECMAECAQLEDFEEQLYKVSGEGDDKYLVATSEQSLCSLFRRSRIFPSQVPIRLCGYSSCFRKEVGAHGKDTLGIFRVHQFEKVEQFIVASPEGHNSWDCLDEMIDNSERLYQALGIPYRVVNIASGELNDAAAKKLDLEAYFPASAAYRELVSASNCTDFQARSLGVRFGEPKKGGPEARPRYAHLLNATLVATTRAICCILENWQEQGGVRVPPPLVPYMHGVSFLPFVYGIDKKGRLYSLDTPRGFRLPGSRIPHEPSLCLYYPDPSEGTPGAYAVHWLVSLVGCPGLRRVADPPREADAKQPCIFEPTSERVIASRPATILRRICRDTEKLYPDKEADVGRTEAWLEVLGGGVVGPNNVVEACSETQSGFLGGKLASVADLWAASLLRHPSCPAGTIPSQGAAATWLHKLSTLKP